MSESEPQAGSSARSAPTRVAVISNRRDQIDHVQNEVVDAAERLGYSKTARFAIRLALEEAVSNAFRHGHAGLPPETPVRVEYTLTPEVIRIAVEDQGPGYDPSHVPDPTLDANLEQLSGRGLTLIRAYMASVRHNDRGNRLEMEYRNPTPPASQGSNVPARSAS
ncbi:MAG: ATP-binding protein [Planctomycetota bacterium]|nr:ATP-binding protein [Planctomycetota bacterium]